MLMLCVHTRKRPKFRFGSGFGWFWPVRFGSPKKIGGSVRARQKFLVRSFPSTYNLSYGLKTFLP